MKEKTCKSVRLSYGIIFSVFTAVVGALFIWQVLELYFTPVPPDFEGVWHAFTRERVIKALSKIDLFFWLWIAGIIVGLVLWEVFPVKAKQRKICPDLQYARLMKKFPLSAPEGMEGDYAAVRRTQKIIFALKVAAWSLFGIACVYGIVYLCIPANFPKVEPTDEVIEMVKHVFPCIFAGLLVICGAAVYEKYAVKNMLPLTQKLTRGAKPEPKALTGVPAVIEKIKTALENKWVVLGVRIAIAVIAVAFIIWGCLNGSARSVFIKAINICTECIGLG